MAVSAGFDFRGWTLTLFPISICGLFIRQVVETLGVHFFGLSDFFVSRLCGMSVITVCLMIM